ncbi:entericidin [Agrobacterium tumefaciens]|uniref:entericidin domain-containing protein n=1 Tax=Agrobacterium tumefaciens TaxID=358 RepID=UPI00287C2B26|nr:entericidin [Agrobacterium tumefaciens]MDS7597243.1 entericidin [Agrobacterium tumefaciens]
MITRIFSIFAVALVAVVTLSSCGNTIRGIGRDTANAVDATQDAGRNVDRAARR